ncbi:MAG: ribosome biogenesis GTPase Der [Patescibacteria group bacterium]|nr:ribosome biogenesis GTPase Der [Patescibacteria group bacterium]MDD5295071.1 ribosome biogenesis GTPase Der [Patescibacteria group bacterium]MDD5554705.1 ribosome biogenesis GTPase Der [Patescibacteria group bacterium]
MNSNNKNNLPTVIIFGRANVGKSTLFNRLVEKNQALVSNIAGTTRDSNINEVGWRGKKFIVVDTGGIIDLPKKISAEEKPGSIEAKVQHQARQYLKRADLILFLVDAKTGLLPMDRQMALFLKKSLKETKKIILVANKVDNHRQASESAEFNKLALGEPFPISAATGAGTGDLLDLIFKKIKFKKIAVPGGEGEMEAVKVCIIGKPNVGKSSLLNSILGYERVIVSPEPHTTREPQDTEIIYKDKPIILVDTAGISKKGTKTKGLEKHGIAKSLKALEKSNIALLVIDINEGITHQDAKLVEEIMERKVSFLIIANKWDLIKKKDPKKYSNYIYGSFPFATWAPIHFTSALTGSKTNKILDLILEINEGRKIILGDSQLNKFLLRIVKIHLPAKGKGVKKPHIYEFKQISSNPPKFQLRIGSRDDLHFSYVRFIANRLREKYGFLGTPIGIEVDKGKKVHGKHEN